MSSIEEILDPALSEGRSVLLEHEGLQLLAHLGLSVPTYRVFRWPQELGSLDLDGFAGDRVVLKVLSTQLLHKSDRGGVAVVNRTATALRDALATMSQRCTDVDVHGWLVVEYVEHEASLGGELLVGLRRTADFGPVLSLALGGVHSELLAQALRPGCELALALALANEDIEWSRVLAGKTLTSLLLEPQRGQPPRLKVKVLHDLLARLVRLLDHPQARAISELEINPLVLCNDALRPVDVLVKLDLTVPKLPPARPLHKLKYMLKPRSVAVIGVSDRPNPGHIIVANLLREGFDREHLLIVKPGRQRFMGCPCVEDVTALPNRVDLMVLAVSAAQAPDLVTLICQKKLAETVILIPGGLGETAGSSDRVTKMRAALTESRSTSWQGPLINGGNCLGVRSKPGGCDTLFIPEHKLPASKGPTSPLALISQSGALAVACASKLARLNPRYIISLGNQLDLSSADYLCGLKEDPEIEVFGCYIEGFVPGDGRRWLQAAREITASGRAVVLYRAGRSPAGRQATATHTASVAGDYVVTRELAAQAGVAVADSLQDFEDLLRTFTQLRRFDLTGRSIAAMSNAGFECVAMADSQASLELAVLSPQTRQELSDLLRRHHLEDIVSVLHPFDATPMLADLPFVQAFEHLLDDPGVDLGILGCVPLTPALCSLVASEHHDEDVASADSVASLLVGLANRHAKPWVVVIDAGEDYDGLVKVLERGGLCVFRSVDRALRSLQKYCQQRLHPARVQDVPS